MSREDLREEDAFMRVMTRDGFSPDLPAALAPGRSALSPAARLLLYMLSGMEVGTLDVQLPGSVLRQFRGSEPGPHGVFRIKNPSGLIRRVLAGGEVGIGDAYLDDCWDSPDLTQLLMALYRNEPHYKGPFEKNLLGRLYGWWRHRRRANTRRVAKKNIEHHYDLGNEFYKMWLDETMAYSSALFKRADESMNATSAMFIQPTETLRDAQLNKFRLMYERLDLRPGHRLLEIGSGWGGFAIYAAQHSGCRVHSITLSGEQLVEARARAAAAGVADRVTFELRDYRDVRETYDRVVSIEMYEAVGEEWWPAYFATIARALRPGGRAAIQGITINPAIFGHYRLKRDFIQKYIFPGGMLPSEARLKAETDRAGLSWAGIHRFGSNYADTLAEWARRFEAAWGEIRGLGFDERFRKLWRFYLSYCEAGFRTERTDVVQLNLAKA